jgi:hypothetical protein
MLTEHICTLLTPGNGLPCKHYLRPDDPTQPGFCTQGARFFCEEAMKHRLPSISYSRLSDFIHCKRRYYHAVIEGLSVKLERLPEPIKLGRAWDAITRGKYESTFDPNLEIDRPALSPVQAAKINGLKRAFEDLGIYINKDRLIACQYRVTTQILRTNLVGIVDRAYGDHLVETKLSARPEFYQQRENIAYQLGTYFLANDEWDYAIVEITRTPFLKLKDGEEPDAYEERVYGDVISRPGHYFLGWDRKTRTFGTRFWRSEFDLDEIHSTYCHVLREIRETVERGSWYPNYLACHVPAPCPYLSIKRSGVVSEKIYTRRNREGGDAN